MKCGECKKAKPKTPNYVHCSVSGRDRHVFGKCDQEGKQLPLFDWRLVSTADDLTGVFSPFADQPVFELSEFVESWVPVKKQQEFYRELAYVLVSVLSDEFDSRYWEFLKAHALQEVLESEFGTERAWELVDKSDQKEYQDAARATLSDWQVPE